MRHLKLLRIDTGLQTPEWNSEDSPAIVLIDGPRKAVSMSICEDDPATSHTVLIVSPEAILGAPPSSEPPHDFICAVKDDSIRRSRHEGEDFHTTATAQVHGASEDAGPALAALSFFLYRYGWSERNTLTHSGQAFLTLVSGAGKDCSISTS